MLQLVARPEISDDLRQLPPALVPVVRALLPVLRERPLAASRPLSYRQGVGNLGDCRKIYFDLPGAGAPRYRMVIRLLPDETAPTMVEVICVGERRDLHAYRSAAARLDRS